MTRFAAPVIVALAMASPVFADDKEGPSLMEQGAKMFFQGLMEEMEPALKELEGMAEEMEPMLKDFAAAMGPALKEMFGKVEDWSLYHPPEMLPNGDIIIRRRTEEEVAEDEPEMGGEIDL